MAAACPPPRPRSSQISERSDSEVASGLGMARPGCIPSLHPCVHALIRSCSSVPARVLRRFRVRPPPVGASRVICCTALGVDICEMGLCRVRALLRACSAACVLCYVRAPLRECSTACAPGLLAWTAIPGSLEEDMTGHVPFCSCSAVGVLCCVRAPDTLQQNPNTTHSPTPPCHRFHWETSGKFVSFPTDLGRTCLP